MLDEQKFVFAFSGIEPAMDEHAIAFYHRHKSVFDPYLQSASEFIGTNLQSLVLSKDNQQNDPLVNQILTYTYGVAMSDVLQKQDIRPTMVAGFSLGVYAALAGAEIVSFEDGLAMVKKAYELMNELSRHGKFSMSAIVGLDEQDIKNIIAAKQLNSIEQANTLNETCIIYSGSIGELKEMRNAAEVVGCMSAVSLDVDIPYHHPRILQNATIDFTKFLDTLNWKKSDIPILSSITQNKLVDLDEIKKFIAENLSQPIHWQKVIEKMATTKNKFIAECGPGLTLTRNGRFIQVDLKYINVKNIQKKLNL